MHWSKVGPKSEIFTHIDDDGTQRTFNVTALENRVARLFPEDGLEFGLVPVTQDVFDFCMKNRGVESHRLMRITREQLSHAQPLLFAAWHDGSTLMINGTHRYCRAYMLGLPDLLGVVVPARVWENYLVEGMPDTDAVSLLNSKSGMP